MRQKFFYGLIVVWTLLVALSFLWNVNVNRRETRSIVLNRGQAFFYQIVATRSWNSSMSGVFGVVGERNQPNPYLADSIRETYTVDGQHLARINPAYMTRQISEMEMYPRQIDIHLTSLNPIRPANKADDWEIAALESFERGEQEVFEKIKTDSMITYRYMAPLITEKSCLACHAVQGYKEGDVRGGIRVAFPAAVFLSAQRAQFNILLSVHLVILLLGIAGIYAYFRMSNRYFSQLKQKNKDLFHLNAKKDKMFSIIAHDLKNPFNSIIGLSDLLVEHGDELEEKEKGEFLASIRQTSKSAYQLLENLLEWALTELKKIPFRPEKVDASLHVGSAIALVSLSAQNKNILLQNRVPEETLVQADKNMLATLFRNLITNAIKYSHPGGTIEITHTLESGLHRFSISDQGVGMTAEQRDNLFTLGSKSTYGTKNEKGTGLGLILCKEFAQKHGGTIWADSEPGKGSTFHFTLPANGKAAES